MFRELIVEYARLRAKGEERLLPTAYKPKPPKWVVELSGQTPRIKEWKKTDVRRELAAPDRQRSSPIPPAFLLLDTAQYVFGKSPDGKEINTRQRHDKYMELLKEAFKETQEPSLQAIWEFLSKPLPDELKPVFQKMTPGDLVAIRNEPAQFPFELESVKDFWTRYLRRELGTEHPTPCLACGECRPIIRIFSREIVIMQQKCQVTSFDDHSFRSFGKEQTTNSPICFDCANYAIDALDFLIRSPRNSSVLTRDESKSASKNPLKNQLAVFWLSQDLPPEQVGEVVIEDPLELLAAAVEDVLPGKPPAMLSQMKDALAYPHMLRARGLNTLVDEAKFNLMVLSANKGRMVVREWLSESVGDVLERLGKYAEATSLIGPWGEPVRPFTVRQLLHALKTTDTNLLRPLLRTAYSGHLPPQGLLNIAVQRIRTLWSKGKEEEYLKEQQRLWDIHAALAAVKLIVTYGKERATTMKELDETEGSVPYLCGRMLAVLEEAQRRASGQDINATIIDRFYSSVAAAPGTHLVRLHNQAMRAHLPSLRRQGRGYGTLSKQLGQLMRVIGENGGLPDILSVQQQGEFGIGYWSQRVTYRKRKEATDQSKGEGGNK